MPLVLKSFCMSCGTSHTLRNTFVCSLAHLWEDTMVHGPTGGRSKFFHEEQMKTGQKSQSEAGGTIVVRTTSLN